MKVTTWYYCFPFLISLLVYPMRLLAGLSHGATFAQALPGGPCNLCSWFTCYVAVEVTSVPSVRFFLDVLNLLVFPIVALSCYNEIMNVNVQTSFFQLKSVRTT